MKVTSGLSTIKNIPIHLRLDFEIDCVFTNEELAEKYLSDVRNAVLKNYVVMSISVVDAILEDLYELFIINIESGISESEIGKKVRGAWVNDNIINYFVTNSGLKKPDDMVMPYDENFMRYKELRLLRHSLVHSDGLISKKNIDALLKFKELTPKERKKFAIIDSPLIANGNQVTLSINSILSIRQYLHRFLLYQLKSIESA